MMKSAFLPLLLIAGISCSKDDEVKPVAVVCTFTFAGDIYGATSAKCQYYPYGGWSELALRKDDEFELLIAQYPGMEKGSVQLTIGTGTPQYLAAGVTVVRNNNGLKVDTELYTGANQPAGRLICDCPCKEGSLDL